MSSYISLIFQRVSFILFTANFRLILSIPHQQFETGLFQEAPEQSGRIH